MLKIEANLIQYPDWEWLYHMLFEALKELSVPADPQSRIIAT